MDLVLGGVQEDIMKIAQKIASYDPCYTFQITLKGSSSESLKILYPDEFDFNLINTDWTGKVGLLQTAGKPAGFGFAIQKQETCLRKFLIANTNHIDPGKVRQHLRDLVNRSLTELNMTAFLQETGPAVNFQLESQPKNQSEIDIDLTISIDLLRWPQNAHNLPDDVKSARAALVPKVLNGSDTDVWQISFSQVEKRIFESIDDDCGCRRQVLKLAKYFKTSSLDKWSPLASYHLKTIMLHLNEEKNQTGDWDESKLVPRFKDLINRLLKHLRERNLPSFFMRQFNLFADKPDLPSAVQAVQDMLTAFRQNPEVLFPKSGDKPSKLIFNDGFGERKYRIRI